MCGSKAATSHPPQSWGSPGEVNGDHILSPHIEGAHHVSIILSSGAIAMMVVGVLIYCLIKNKLVRCCAKDNPAHLVEQGGTALPSKRA